MTTVLRRRLFVVLVLLLGFDCLYLVLTCDPFLIWFASRFRVEDPLLPSDAIVMLLGGPWDRPGKAAELYRRGLAPVILMGDTGRASGEAAYHRQLLIREGVSAASIETLPGESIESTYDEAIRVREYVRNHPIRRITVVTSAYHTARARWTFRKVLDGSGVEIRMAASQNPRFTEANWHLSDSGLKLYLGEAIKTLYYRLVY